MSSLPSQATTTTTTTRRAAVASRLKPSIAQSIIRPQNLSTNIFTSSTNKKQAKTNDDQENNKQPTPSANPAAAFSSSSQFPFSFPHLAGLGLAMASNTLNSNDHHHHHHHNMEHSSPALEPEVMNHCSMNMVFNSQPIGTCIVFRQFYVSGTMALLFYLSLLFVIAVGYEYLRLASNRFERMIQVKLSGGASKRALSPPRRVSSNENLIDNPAASLVDGSNLSLINPKLASWGQISVPRSIQLTRSLFYVSNVALSFFLMLVVMTYNAQIILAVLAGAFVGHFVFHREISFGQPDKGMACH
ncbi:uncharacterized protein PGTG_02149 [Puccinia graminis f. sp. tritici CRL 75-36-700-3]|uniref:Copper transport protein n=1 Tax=Puccinia graminis f. sp. tritici (strain CRL 75-36-700-3 / race SCCL) TaxID=418459 RepID=E3JXB3_PUCGT|nr:uncharacterized protein PGTG_02149 [Puccinia graminis f. sp. tritici CRL 75-36-700-3]EFP76688.1 hypothetical protein PGTG_02149 [Puccinia graminis f. sp. tritici CRL 75-36-700-3]